jgi:hypothetical protein
MTTRDPDPIGNDLRRAKASRARPRRLPEGASCPHCGEDDPGKLQLHEPGGRANDPDGWVVLCKRCHRSHTAAQPGFGIELKPDPNRSMPEQLVSVLRGIGLLLELLAETCRWWADRLAALISGLDGGFPGWRELPAA